MKNITRSIYLLTILAVLALPLAACRSSAQESTSGELQGNIAISGAFALYPLMQRWTEEYQKLYPKVTFDVSAGGAGKGMTDALSGAVDIGMVSRAITPEEEAQGAYWVAVTKDAVFITVNASNPALQDLLKTGVPKDRFIKLYITGEIKTWGELVGKPEIKDEIHIYTRSDACGAGETWAKYLDGKKQEDLLGVGVFGDPGLLDAVVKDPLGIGYNNLNYAFDMSSGAPVAGTVVVPIDYNENGVADLNLVTKDKPVGVVQAFILWILTDGQKYVGEVGYVALTPEQLDESIQKVK
jgi:phosphate transport system substrate-binding protein